MFLFTRIVPYFKTVVSLSVLLRLIRRGREKLPPVDRPGPPVDRPGREAESDSGQSARAPCRGMGHCISSKGPVKDETR